MKHTLAKALAIAAITTGLFGAASQAEAYTNCRWVPGHYVNGYYVHGHRVCWHGYNGYRYGHGNRYCGWRNGHRVCWYR